MIFHVYSKPNCSWCVKAKALLKNKGLEFRELELGTDYTKDDLLSWFPNVRTLPQIELFCDGATPDHIGGYEDLVKYLEGNNVSSSES
jgi:glutaredoxin 3